MPYFLESCKMRIKWNSAMMPPIIPVNKYKTTISKYTKTRMSSLTKFVCCLFLNCFAIIPFFIPIHLTFS